MSKLYKDYEIVEESEFFSADGRLHKGVLDEWYIEAYLDNPRLKPKEVMEQAVYDAGITYEVKGAGACNLHKRLLPEIERRLMELNTDDKALGRSVIRKLCMDADSENVRGQMAIQLSKGLYPDVVIKKEMSLEEIDRELMKLERENEGIELH